MANIIIIEDDVHTLRLIENVISHLGEDIHVFTSESAEDASRILDQNDIDGAFIDINLPGMDGFELARNIRKTDRYHFLPIIFATGIHKDHPDTYKEYHNFNYITKPLTAEKLKEIGTDLIKEIKIQKRVSRKKKEREIPFRYDGGMVRIRFSDVLYASTTIHRKIKLVTRQHTYLRSNITLQNLLTEFGEKMFIQCHRSCAVNVNNIESITPVTYKSWDICFYDASDEKCQLSRSHRKGVEALIGIRDNKKDEVSL